VISNFRAIILPLCLFLTLISIVCFSIVTIPVTVVLGLTSQSFWTEGDNMPTPRGEHGAIILGDKIYVIGGRERPGFKTDVVEVYDLKSKEWSTAAPLPVGLDHFGLSANNGKLYLVGGTMSNDTLSNKLYVYDPNRDKWDNGKPMPFARTALVANFIDGKLYAIGGIDNAHNVLTTNQVYDSKTDSWTEKAPMPTARHHMTSSVVDGKLYVIGGRLLGDGIDRPVNEALSNFNDNEMYDPVTNTWTKLEQMPTKRSGLTSAVVGTDIYVMGGQSVNGTFGANEKYDTSNNTWVTEPSLPTPRLGLRAVAANDTIYVFGGQGPARGLISSFVEIFHVADHL